MGRPSDTGESVAAINARAADRAWPQVKAALEAGAVLERPAKLRDYYTMGPNPGDPRRFFPAARVKQLERQGVLRRVGVDTYALADGGAA